MSGGSKVSRRGAIAGGVLVLWLAGLGMLARRELFRGDVASLAEAGGRVVPGAVFYVVEQGGTQVGFASSTIDTTTTGIRVDDYFIADLPVGGKLHRATASSRVGLSRALAMREFSVALESEAGPIRVSGRADGDSVLAVAIGSGDEPPADTQRVATGGPVLLPTLVPLAAALQATPKVGRRYTIPVFDPTAMGARSVSLVVRAQSLFVVSDSAALDPATKRWRTARTDSVWAWEIVSESENGFSAWVDASGRVVELTQPGNFVLRRMAYEVAYENWRLDGRARPRGVTADEDILESTAIAASVPLGARPLSRLSVRLGNVRLAGFDLNGTRQELRGDTVTIVREPPARLVAAYTLPASDAFRARFANELRAEPLLQSNAPEVVALARQLAAGSRDPRVVAERLNRWLHDSLDKEVVIDVPNAVRVLEWRKGDCNEHTQLFLALARAAGIPARGAAGLAYLRGKFYYHAWPEVYLGDWVAVDPTFGQFPADAAHIRFVTGGLARQAELLRLIGNLKVDVVAKG